jgi:hypothetical protein
VKSLALSRPSAYLVLLGALLLTVPPASPAISQTRAGGVRVELGNERPLRLRITLRSGSEKTEQIFYNELPWGSQESMVIVAALAGGRSLARDRPVEDPQARPMSLGPHSSLTGDIDLERRFPDIHHILKESDVQLFWAYEAPEALHIPRWSGGWILIPQQP